MSLLKNCFRFFVLAQSSPFDAGISKFKTTLKQFLASARAPIADKFSAQQLASLIAAHKQERSATPNAQTKEAFDTANKNIVMLEDYFIKWLSFLAQKNPASYSANFPPTLLNVLSTMLFDYKLVLSGNVATYKPFTLLIDNQNVPVDLDRLEDQERMQNDIY